MAGKGLKNGGQPALDYDVMVSRNRSDLLAQVSRRISQGWRPIGGCSVAYPASNDGSGMGATYAQAMIKEAAPRKWWRIAARGAQ